MVSSELSAPERPDCETVEPLSASYGRRATKAKALAGPPLVSQGALLRTSFSFIVEFMRITTDDA